MKPTSEPRRRRFCRLNLEALEDRTLLSTFMVDRLTDSGEGSGLAGDLRYCITQATSGQDSIDFGVTGTINLTKALPDLTTSVSIDGPGADLLTVRGGTGGGYFILKVGSGATVGISGLTIANGMATPPALGGGIYNDGTLTVSNSTLSGNFAREGGGIYNSPSGVLTVRDCTLSRNGGFAFGGGGIYNDGTVTVSNSTLSGNDFTGSKGGGIYNSPSGVLTVSNSTLSGNGSRDALGGAIGNDGEMTVNSSTFSRNLGTWGGGIYNGGTLTVSNSTFSGNVADSGGAIDADGTVTVTNSTLSSNFAYYIGSAIFGGGSLALSGSTISGNRSGGNDSRAGAIVQGGVGLSARNTIIAGNTGAGPDVRGALTSLGHNLIGVNPLLGPLQDNGGPTQTMAPLPGSPAVDAGDNTGAPDFDQRGPGFPRIVGGVIDIGAFEVQPGPASHFQLSAPAQVTSNTPFDVTVTALDAYGHTAVGYHGTVTFGATDTDPGVLLPADYTFTADDQGVHPFVGAFVLITLGDQTLTATDTADQTITGSASVAVIPGPTPPPGGSANGPGNPTVITDRTPVQSAQQVALVDRLFASINGKESGFIVAGELSPEKYPVTIY